MSWYSILTWFAYFPTQQQLMKRCGRWGGSSGEPHCLKCVSAWHPRGKLIATADFALCGNRWAITTKWDSQKNKANTLHSFITIRRSTVGHQLKRTWNDTSAWHHPRSTKWCWNSKRRDSSLAFLDNHVQSPCWSNRKNYPWWSEENGRQNKFLPFWVSHLWHRKHGIFVSPDSNQLLMSIPWTKPITNVWASNFYLICPF